MSWSVPYLVFGRILQFLIVLGRGDRAKEVEILVLRHQVAVLRRRVNRPDLGDGDRGLLAALSRLLPHWSWSMFFVTPATLLRWHCDLVARMWTCPRKPPGRPSTRKDIGDAVLRLARENPAWAISGSAANSRSVTAFGNRLGDAVTQVLIQQAQGHRLQRPGHGRNLGEDVDAVRRPTG